MIKHREIPQSCIGTSFRLDRGVEMPRVGKTREVELLENTDRSKPRCELIAVHDDVIAAPAGEQFDVDHFRRIVEVVIDFYAELGLESLDRVGCNVVCPVIDIDDGSAVRTVDAVIGACAEGQ